MHTHHDYQEWSSGDVIIDFEILRGENMLAEGSEEPPGGEDSNDSLEDAARDEQEYLRQRLRDELKREPSEEEMNEWLRQHTEGY